MVIPFYDSGRYTRSKSSRKLTAVCRASLCLLVSLYIQQGFDCVPKISGPTILYYVVEEITWTEIVTVLDIDMRRDCQCNFMFRLNRSHGEMTPTGFNSYRLQ